jgi:hypothetical protein
MLENHVNNQSKIICLICDKYALHAQSDGGWMAQKVRNMCMFFPFSLSLPFFPFIFPLEIVPATLLDSIMQKIVRVQSRIKNKKETGGPPLPGKIDL